MALCFLIGGLTKLRTSEIDYEQVQVECNTVYMAKYGRSRSMIVIEDKQKTYYIYPQLLANSQDMVQVLRALEKSSTATIWYEGSGWVRGIKTEYLTIPPSHGLDRQHKDGRWAVGFSIFFFLAGIGFYLYMKWYYKEDWIEGSVAPKYQTFGTEPQNKNQEFTKLDL